MSLLAGAKRALSGLLTRSTHQRMSRALVKPLLSRVLMVLITVLVAFSVTGNTADALSIGLVANAVKTGIYYGYERLWDRVSWGVAGET